MMKLSSDVLDTMKGRTLCTAESCTGGGIGALLTSVSGSSAVYKGGVICYTNWVKQNVLNVDPELLDREGAVSAPVAQAMAEGVRQLLCADVAVSVTGLAGPGGDDYGNPVGTVYIGYADDRLSKVEVFYFEGTRDEVRAQAEEAALRLILINNS